VVHFRHPDELYGKLVSPYTLKELSSACDLLVSQLPRHPGELYYLRGEQGLTVYYVRGELGLSVYAFLAGQLWPSILANSMVSVVPGTLGTGWYLVPGTWYQVPGDSSGQAPWRTLGCLWYQVPGTCWYLVPRTLYLVPGAW
jgi:hypothetical protein